MSEGKVWVGGGEESAVLGRVGGVGVWMRDPVASLDEQVVLGRMRRARAAQTSAFAIIAECRWLGRSLQDGMAARSESVCWEGHLRDE